MLVTRTGSFPIGFRRGWSEWQQTVTGPIEFAKANGLGVIDIGTQGAEDIKAVVNAGLKIGTVDLLEWKSLFSADKAKRADAVAKNNEYIAATTAAGARNFFIVVLPENAELPRSENFGYAVESLNAITPALEAIGGRIVIEGWPGPGALACTPEGYRAVTKECPSKAIGINFDPSHLIRMGIDPIRFIDEFAPRVAHVHGKDTELLTENLYELGTEQPATFAKPHVFGGNHWRYAIPGHGLMRWTRAFTALASVQFSGAVTIELEDDNFNGSEEGEKLGLLLGAQYLAGC
jgi:sugar phosphate isomerase/epimerase